MKQDKIAAAMPSKISVIVIGVVIVVVMMTMVALVSADVYGAVIISEALYDPITSESDSEYIEIYNTANAEVDIGGYRINTTSLQATIPDGTMLPALTHYLIADIDNTDVWPTEWPAPDLAKEISLTNTNSGIILIDSDGNIIDALGWGNPAASLFLGTAHPYVTEGSSISRRNIATNPLEIEYSITGNNSVDYLESGPNPQSMIFYGNNPSNGSVGNLSQSINQSNIVVVAEVLGSKPVISAWSIIGDDSPESGIQILPFAGNTRELVLKAVIYDNDGEADIESVIIRMVEPGNLAISSVLMQRTTALNDSSAVYEARIQLAYHQAPGKFNITIESSDVSGLNSTCGSLAAGEQPCVSFDYLPIVAFAIDTASLEFQGISGESIMKPGDLDMSTTSRPTIKNLGNTELDFYLSGTDLMSGSRVIPVSQIKYTFLDTDFLCSYSGRLQTLPVKKEVGLAAGTSSASMRELSLQLDIPQSASSGSYEGTIRIEGVSS